MISKPEDVAANGTRCRRLVGLFVGSGLLLIGWSATSEISDFQHLREYISVAAGAVAVLWLLFFKKELPAWKERHIRHIVERRMIERHKSGANQVR